MILDPPFDHRGITEHCPYMDEGNRGERACEARILISYHWFLIVIVLGVGILSYGKEG